MYGGGSLSPRPGGVGYDAGPGTVGLGGPVLPVGAFNLGPPVPEPMHMHTQPPPPHFVMPMSGTA
eukprot:3912615-Rhodomonas_salina.1